MFYAYPLSEGKRRKFIVHWGAVGHITKSRESDKALCGLRFTGEWTKQGAIRPGISLCEACKTQRKKLEWLDSPIGQKYQKWTGEK